jgi:hypothetical protein
VHSECVSPSSRTVVRIAETAEIVRGAPGPIRASLLSEMPALRSFLSIPALLVAMASLTGCYDLSAPSGPHREDFVGSPSASEPSADGHTQGEQAQAERSEQAATAATKATTASDPTGIPPHAAPLDATVAQAPGGGLSVAEYVARYIHPAPTAD